jgi:hypothetical protein
MDRLGRYRLVDTIAKGGMAEVYLATLEGSAGFTRPLAIKCILPNKSTDTAHLTMLVDEARISSVLSHPNIVPVMDFGQDQGRFFLVMEYVSGRHLGQVLARAIQLKERLPVGLALSVLRDALLGLHHAHTRVGPNGSSLRIVHRDISPQNILVGYDGGARVGDFGIATAQRRATRTEVGTIKGKTGYLSPEQALGDDLDGRSDIYSAAVVLWEALALRRMFAPAEPLLSVAERIVRGDLPELDTLRPDLPAPLLDLVRQALARHAVDRPADAAEFARSLTAQLATVAPGWTTQQTAEWMQRVFASEYQEDAAALSRLQGPSAAAVGRVSASRPQRAPTGAGAQPHVGPAGSHPGGRRRRQAGAAVVAAVVGIGAVVTVRMGGDRDSPGTRAQARSTAEPVQGSVAGNTAAQPEPRAFLTVRSSLPAMVFVDDVDTGRTTPLVDFPVTPGAHRVGLVNTDRGITRIVKVTLAPEEHRTIQAAMDSR